MLAEAGWFVRVEVAWLLASLAFVPLFWRSRIGLVESWLAARVLGPTLFTLIAFHVARWSHCDLGTAVGVTGAIAVLIQLLPLANGTWRELYRKAGRGQVRRAVWRCEFLIQTGVLVLVGVFGFYYGPYAHGERPMDLGLVNGLMHCASFPPEHFWAAGDRLFYYYFGSLVAAALGKLAFIPGYSAYFFTLVIVWVQCVIAAWLCARVMGARGVAAWLGPICLVLLGTAAPLYQLANFGISPMSGAALVKSLRVIPGTINEVPPSAFWASELHAHVAALPLMIIVLFLVVGAVRHRSWVAVVLAGVTGGMLLMTDAWQMPGIVLAAGVLGLLELRRSDYRRSFGFGAAVVFGVCAAAASSALLVGFKGYPVRFRWVHQSTTRSVHLITLFGPVLVAVIVATVVGTGSLRRRLVTAAPLLVCALGVLSVCEIVYLDMGLPAPGERQNTVMRFHYTAYVLLALAAPVAAGAIQWRIVPHWRAVAIGFLAVWIAAFSVLNVLPAIGARQAKRARECYWTVDVRQGLDPEHTGAIQVAEWLEHNTPPGTVIAESGGHPYRGFSLISAMSGRPTVFGEIDKLNNAGVPGSESAGRFEDLLKLYSNSADAPGIIAKYGIKRLVVGPAEQTAFQTMNGADLIATYPIAAKRGQVWLLDVTRRVVK